jgi:hypothetical protein
VSPEERALGLYVPEDAPFVTFCDYLRPHLEQSGATAEMRSSAKWANAEYLSAMLALWLVPVSLVYALALAFVRAVQSVGQGE